MDILPETMEDKKRVEQHFKMLKEKNHPLRIPYPVEISYKNDHKLKEFLDEG